MTKKEWQNSTDIQEMLRFAKLSKRKERLFACSCVRHIWHLLKDDRSKKAVEVAELYADNKVGEEELEQARQDAWDVAVSASYASYAFYAASYAAASYTDVPYASYVSYASYAELEWQANLLRHMVKIHD